MATTTVAVALLATLIVPVGGWASDSPAAGFPRLQVLVRVESRTSDRSLKVGDIIAEIQSIWQPYVDLYFTEPTCGMNDAYDDDILVVITEKPPVRRAYPALGWIEFATDFPLNTVIASRDAVAAITDEGSWGFQRVVNLPDAYRERFLAQGLGRVVSHEMGHYLLRSKAHSKRGLMRRTLKGFDLVASDRQRLFGLQPEEKRSLDSRTGALLQARAIAHEGPASCPAS